MTDQRNPSEHANERSVVSRIPISTYDLKTSARTFVKRCGDQLRHPYGRSQKLIWVARVETLTTSRSTVGWSLNRSL
ncbi:uncharacterized protein METZ01_LOCUS13878 [marine metagenome]|uniref:Uncharacterized protein n=1 Tax=marine metagenome TaxID=408172 RepID=A0A381P398_9ZZZZ